MEKRSYPITDYELPDYEEPRSRSKIPDDEVSEECGRDAVIDHQNEYGTEKDPCPYCAVYKKTILVLIERNDKLLWRLNAAKAINEQLSCVLLVSRET